MNTAKHTPGPWNCVDPHVIRGPKNVVVAKTLDSKEGYEIKQANAHLIAAAPAMYEALTHALSVCEAEAELRGENDIDDYLGGAAGPVARMIRAALAQAEGKP